MPRYANGYIPTSALVKIASGTDSNGYWEHLGSPHTIAIWRATQAYAQKKWGRAPKVRNGWNIYRPYAVQVAARKRAADAGQPLAAAYPGTSSHGGTWTSTRYTGGKTVDALAIDVDPNGLTWAQVWEAARAQGFLCGAITPAIAGIDEPWHVIDLNPWAAVPAAIDSDPFPVAQRKQKNMILLEGIDSTSGTASILVVAGPGVWDRYANSDTVRASLIDQFGKPVVLSKESMIQKEALYKGAVTTAGEINNALQDDFAAVVAAVKAIPAATIDAGTLNVSLTGTAKPA